MAEFVTVGSAADVPEGDMKVFNVGDAPILVARIDGSLYAFSDICTHQGCNLKTGELEGTEIECECHGSVFDITTGEVVSPPAQDPLPVYPVREEGGSLQIQV
jgi:3-phenylpropionate/trans-cinnamate dioxygenase ferredoxin component